MIRRSFLVASFLCFFASFCPAQTVAPKPCGPIPSKNQQRWQKMEFYAFVHLSVNTFTDQEWGNGDEDAKIFNPDKLDCRQWARIASEAGMKGIIITAKHHSGFCLWPSKYTDFSVKNSPWRGGKGDIVRDLANACREYGLKLGIYLSPWDRNSAVYGRPEYITYFRNQLRELLTNYGDIFEVWFDGANGGSGYYGGARETRTIDRKTYYDWKNTYQLVRQLQPKAVIWNDGGDRGDLRWVGTEGGNVGETNWSLLNATGDVSYDMLHYGVENGDSWVPAEVNTSIRPGWFYHEYEDGRVKSLPQLLDTYYSSEGRNGTLLLNFPIDRHGLIHENDERAVLEFGKAVRAAFAVNLAGKAKAVASNVRGGARAFGAEKAIDDNSESYWATDDSVTTATLTLDLGGPTTFNRFLAQEYIRLGQRVKAFTLEALAGGEWKELAKGTTIGYKRILCFPTVSATQVRLTITDAKRCPLISNVGVFNAPQVLTAPEIKRNRAGEIKIQAADRESVVYYTIDGSTPGAGSKKYTGPFPEDGKVEVRAVAYDSVSAKSSPISREQFDINRKDWKILGTDDEKAYNLFDGDPATAWQQPHGGKMPVDLVIDLGKPEELAGFRYLPDQGWLPSGMITNYQLYVSMDNVDWKLADEGEFSNIRNNPAWQIKKFAPVQARYIRLRALNNTKNDDAAGYAEVDVITQ
jgi:alpha-L-fucosidase